MKTLNEFRLSADKDCEGAMASLNYEPMTNSIKQIITYDGWVEIAELKNGNHHLVIGNREYEGDLEQLEILLWDWVKYENRVDEDDITEDLHQRCRDIMEELDEQYGRDESMSLDEYHCKYLSENSVDDTDKIEYLLRQF